MERLKITLIAGFAMFSMFFGSGNLVFPLYVGSQSYNLYAFALAGMVITAVAVPFLGLMGMVLFDGNRPLFFSSLGRIPAFALTFAMLAMMGPFGVIPRCITVGYGGIGLIYPSFSYAIYSAIFTLMVASLVWRENRIVDIIGIVLSPWKIGAFLLLIGAGILYGAEPLTSQMIAGDAFKNGFFKGYQMMDLIAAFFFSATIIKYLRQNMNEADDSKYLFSMSLKACIMGASLLAIFYAGFIFMGASYATHLINVAPEAMLTAITHITLGHYAAPVMAFTLAIATLATAVILTALFVDFVVTDISGGRLTRPQAIMVTSVITYAMSLLGFKQICSILGSILEFAYPALIVFSILAILSKCMNRNYSAYGFWITVVLTGAVKWVF